MHPVTAVVDLCYGKSWCWQHWLLRIVVHIIWATFSSLTNLPLVPHKCVSEWSPHWYRYWLVAGSASSHYLNQCCQIVYCALGNKLQWNFNQNSKLFVHKKCIWKYHLRNGGHFVQGQMSSRVFSSKTGFQRIEIWYFIQWCVNIG